jgi:hypothetical protein
VREFIAQPGVLAQEFIGRIVRVEIDRPLGSRC